MWRACRGKPTVFCSRLLQYFWESCSTSPSAILRGHAKIIRHSLSIQNFTPKKCEGYPLEFWNFDQKTRFGASPGLLWPNGLTFFAYFWAQYVQRLGLTCIKKSAPGVDDKGPKKDSNFAGTIYLIKKNYFFPIFLICLRRDSCLSICKILGPRVTQGTLQNDRRRPGIE